MRVPVKSMESFLLLVSSPADTGEIWRLRSKQTLITYWEHGKVVHLLLHMHTRWLFPIMKDEGPGVFPKHSCIVLKCPWTEGRTCRKQIQISSVTVPLNCCSGSAELGFVDISYVGLPVLWLQFQGSDYGWSGRDMQRWGEKRGSRPLALPGMSRSQPLLLHSGKGRLLKSGCLKAAPGFSSLQTG